MTDIKYIQLEPAAFLTDIDFQMMDAEARGVYCSVIFYLYCNGGNIDLADNKTITLLEGKTSVLAVISGCLKIGPEWDTLWAKIADKFQITGNILSHKRVTAEITKAEDYRKAKSEAGKKGMAARWGGNIDITKVSKGKVSKSKVRKEKKRKETFTPPTLQQVQEYIRQNNYDVDAQTFIWHYSKLGWKNTNGKPVKNWKQTLIQVWVKKDERSTTTQGQRTGTPQAGNRDSRPHGKPGTEFIR